jgi:two-component system chemotaxis sensor kinase CheA
VVKTTGAGNQSFQAFFENLITLNVFIKEDLGKELKMRKIDKKIVQTLKKTGNNLDSLSLNDCTAWKNICGILKKVIKDIPKKKMSRLNKLLHLCMEGVEAISEKSATDPLSLVDLIFEGIAASQEYLLEHPDREILVSKAGKELAKALNQDPNDWDLPTGLPEDSVAGQPGRLTLDDTAALLIQIESDDIPGLASLHEALETITADESYNSASREVTGKALNIVEEIIKRNVPDPDSAIAEVGNLIEKAMNAMEGNESKKVKANSETRDKALDEKAATSISEDQEEDQPSMDSDQKSEYEPTVNDSRTNYMPEDPDFDLIGEFITEGLDLITAAEEALLSLENDPDDKEAVGTVFRAFHTIKGTSAFMELSIISEMAHHAETLLSRVRDGEIRYSGGYADLTLRALDMLKELIESVEPALGGEPLCKPAGYDELLRLLESPEKAGISEEYAGADIPRIGDILVAQGKIERAELEEAANSPRLGDIMVAQGKVERSVVEEATDAYPDKKIGKAIVESKAASVMEVSQALRAQRQIKDGKKSVEATIRVGTDRLDRLIDMVGELVISHSMVAQDEAVVNNGNYKLLKKVAHTGKIVRELQDMSMSMRMVPLKATFQKMTRLVRDLARSTGKKVNFVTEGEDTEIDRNMADAIKDPLVHIIRNAVDHGIEAPEVRAKTKKPKYGLIHLSAYHSAGSVVVEIKDDGKGIDREAILNKAIEKGLIGDGKALSDREVLNIIFEPGFSTAEKVTDVSGRGVGMDVVKKNIEALRGQSEIQSEMGKGSVFQMRLPLTLAIIDGMVARVGKETYVIPMLSIVTSIKPDPKEFSTVLNRGEMLTLQGKLIPLFRLADLFQIEGAEQNQDEQLVVVIEDDKSQAGLIIDELIGRQQVVIKSLGETMHDIPGISGSAIMPNGRVGLILDASGIMKFATSGNGEGVIPANEFNGSRAKQEAIQ